MTGVQTCALPILERIVAQGLDKQPEQRPLMQDFINVLKAGSSGPCDTRAHPPGLFQQLAERVKRLRPRRRGWWWRWAEKRSIRNPMHEMRPVDDPHPIDRWFAETRGVLGRVIPTLIADRDRLRESLVGRERDCERLGKELDDVSRDLGALRGEIERLRGERAAMAQAVADLLGQLEQPLAEIARRSGRRF